MTTPITMSLMGGLGNQLFQLAAGLEVAKRTQLPLSLDLSWFDQPMRRRPGGLVLRPYELDGIADDIPKVRDARSGVEALMRHGRDVAARRTARLLNRTPLRGYAEAGASFDPSVFDVRPGTHLWGYFASWRYFPTVAESMRRRVLESDRLTAAAAAESNRATAESAIALHIRRGDYLELTSTYGHVAPDYYRRGVRLLRALGEEGPLWVYSDDPAGAEAFLSDSVSVDRLIQPQPGESSLDSLVAMSGAAALVIANSTFSWWAAFLRDTPSRPVVAPRPMWASDSQGDGRDLVCPHWLTVECREFD